MTSRRVVLIDNYDSYVYNLFQRIGEITGDTAVVFRNNQTTVDHISSLNPTHLILSPGPGNPENPEYFGIGAQLIQELGSTVPILGVCLGHQGIGHAFGAKVVRASRVMHGKTSKIQHDGSRIFQGLPMPMTVMRYHSLVVQPESLPRCLKPTAWADDGALMAVEHSDFPIFGVQFHPESIGTPDGPSLLKNFLAL